MKRARVAIGLVALLALASVGLAGCGSGQGTTRAAGLPTESRASSLGRLAYELDGDIYVKALPDGEPRRIAEGTIPRWSPSGEWLLVYNGSGDWVMRADGTGRRPVAGAAIAWSPREDRLAYVGSTALFVENADGSSRREIGPIDVAPWGLEWSPDGTRLAYDQEAPMPARRGSLWVVDVDGAGRPVELYGTTTDGILAAGWTADGAYVLFWRDIQFSASMMADGLPLEAIPAQGGPPLALAAGHLALWAPSPSGETVAMSVPAGRCTWTQKRIAVVDAAGGALQYLTPEDRASIQPAWSPDGTRIAFVSKPDVGDGPGGPGWVLEEMAADRRIWVMNADGSGQRPLTDDAAYRDEHPLWSADGSQILFARLDGERHASLWLMAEDGGEPQQVVDAIGSSAKPLTGYYTNIGWSAMYDWWQPPPEQAPATPTPTATIESQLISGSVPSPLDSNNGLHPLIRGLGAGGDIVITDSGERIHVGPSSRGFLWRFEPGERWLVSREDGTALMSGTVAGEAQMYEWVYGFVWLDGGGTIAYSNDINGDWVVYSAQEVCRALEQSVRIPARYIQDSVLDQTGLVEAVCLERAPGYMDGCREKTDGEVLGIAICMEKLGITDGLQIGP